MDSFSQTFSTVMTTIENVIARLMEFFNNITKILKGE